MNLVITDHNLPICAIDLGVITASKTNKFYMNQLLNNDTLNNKIISVDYTAICNHTYTMQCVVYEIF